LCEIGVAVVQWVPTWASQVSFSLKPVWVSVGHTYSSAPYHRGTSESSNLI